MRQRYIRIICMICSVGVALAGCEKRGTEALAGTEVGAEAETGGQELPAVAASEPPALTEAFAAGAEETAGESERPYPNGAGLETLDQAVAAAILEFNQQRYSGDGEVFGEGHIIMDTREEADFLTVYAKTMYGGYQFQDGNFVKETGSGSIPAVIRFSKEPDGTYEAVNYQIAMDGGEYVSSIHELFPEELWERCISLPESEAEELEAQERAYAANYLKKIGREAVIGEFGDFPHTIYSDVGISVEVSNELDYERKYADSDLTAYVPFWLGNIERLEGETRYIYEHSYDPGKREIIYSKIEYDSGEVVERLCYNSETGKRKGGQADSLQ